MACVTHFVNKSLISAEYERKKELERRRILRILQVRQQSNDFADKLRENIKTETLNKRNTVLKLKRKQMQEKHLEEMKILQDIYGICLKNVGTSHREAAKQPDINLLNELEAAQKSTEAALRGAKARKKQLDEKLLQDQKTHAPIEQKVKTRNRENMRSFFISCLPKQSTVDLHRKSSRSPKKVLTKKNLQSDRNLNILKEVPSNVLIPEPRETPYSVLNKSNSKARLSNNPVEGHIEQVSKQTCDEAQESTRNIIPEPLNECSCDYLVCSCHSEEQVIRRRCYSESTVSSEHTLESKKPKIRTRSCSPQTVRTLNYCSIGNVYESKEQNFTKVKCHPKTSLTNLEGIISQTPGELTSENSHKNKELIKKTEERSLKALQREQLKKDFQQLLQDLRNVKREKLVARNKNKSKAGVYQRERDILTKHENKQKKLADAFESLLQTVKHSPPKSRDLTTNMYWPPLDPSSPPTLNLATYQQNKMATPRHPAQARRVILSDEVTTSETPPVTCSRLCESPEQTVSVGREQHSEVYPVEEQYSTGGQCLRSNQQSREEQYSGGGQFVKRRHHPMTNRYNEKECPPLILCNQDNPQPSERSPDSGTSYYSLPEHLTPSQKQLLDTLLDKVKTKKLNKKLKLYIEKLLSMSRESIENLPSSPCLDTARNIPSIRVDESMRKMTELVNDYAGRLNRLAKSIEEMEDCASPIQHYDLPEHIAPDLTRNPPSPTTLPKCKPHTPSPSPMERKQAISLSPLSEYTQIPLSSQYQNKPSPSISPIQQPHSDRSPLRQLASEIIGIQTPFGLPSNLLPDPKDYYREAATSVQPQDQQIQSSPNESDDSTAWAFAGLPTPPARPPDASPIDEKKLFMERFGYPPEEDCDDLDLSNLSTEMKKILGIKVDNLRECPKPRFSSESTVIGSSIPIKTHNTQRNHIMWSDQRAAEHWENCEDIEGTEACAGVEVCDKLSPLNLDNIRQRISDVCFENYKGIIEFLEGETEEDRSRLMSEICRKFG